MLEKLPRGTTSFIVTDQDEPQRDYDIVVMPAIGVMVATELALSSMRVAAEHIEEFIIAIEPEGTKRALGLREAFPLVASGKAWDETKYTWGLQATGCDRTTLSGEGIRVAVLDTGVDLTHPDLAKRIRRHHTACFIPGRSDVADVARHGTHCVGTLGGGRFPQVAPGYGVAYNSEVWVGKVLGDDGNGKDSWILRGIHWAVRHHCRVISMSLGTPVSNGEPYSKVYEAVAARALEHGTLIVAAAGNDSSRYLGRICPVSSPANCPSILSVAALDSIEQNSYAVADFSNSGLIPDGGSVDLAAPGVFVYSSFPMPVKYSREAGTSMATPHVAGIAALLLEEDPTRGAREIWRLLRERAKPLSLSGVDVGAGLVSAQARKVAEGFRNVP
ncbi:S8 family serine peptidase [Bradyrhizobium sp. 179]|uniref:S8 family serine peptidase n=1 Tax=Bradyrhizobium sp. 179 TaxID=2782648 RepID=UPI001FF8E1D3|nr:S8 family serine peptidase [Bradyrhizobium sp. 179]MCK1541896.1 S8 family serine peptidase [Bradyrhizobium sp. 179]